MSLNLANSFFKFRVRNLEKATPTFKSKIYLASTESAWFKSGPYVTLTNAFYKSRFTNEEKTTLYIYLKFYRFILEKTADKISKEIFSPSLSLSNHKNTQSTLSANFYNYFLVCPLSQSYFIVSASNNTKGSVFSQLENLLGKSR